MDPKIQIKIIEINSSNYSSKEHIDNINAALSIQKVHHYKDSNFDKNSFLITKWEPCELGKLIQRGATLYLGLTQSDHVCGYILVSEIDEFILQIRNSKHTFDEKRYASNKEKWKYIYQIAVNKISTRRGIGSYLLTYAMKQSIDSKFLSDFMIAPFKNVGSQVLFQKLGFENAGELFLKTYRGFEPSTWQIVIHTTPPKLGFSKQPF